MEKWRDRKFRLLLYPEDPTHQTAMQFLAQSGTQYVAILHDSDMWEDGDEDIGEHEPGTPKKEHWHVVVKYQNARWSHAIAKEMGIKENYIKKCDNFDGALVYLVHEGFPDKFQYDFEKVFGPLAPNLAKLLASTDQGSRVLKIIDMIDAIPGKVSYREILIKVCQNGLFGDFRKLGSGAKWLIDEHNAEIAEVMNGNRGVAPSFDEFNEYVRFHQHIVKTMDEGKI